MLLDYNFSIRDYEVLSSELFQRYCEESNRALEAQTFTFSKHDQLRLGRFFFSSTFFFASGNLVKRNSPSVQRPCVTIIVPHPDDLEVLTNHFVQYFIAKDFQVYEILFSWGEYGVVNRFDIHEDSLKGKKLRKIRKLENAASKAEYGYFSNGDPHVITIPMGYIDGLFPFRKNPLKGFLKWWRNLIHK